MTEIKVTGQRDGTFAVHLTAPDGATKIVPGFTDEHEAAVWGVQAQRLYRKLDPTLPVVARDPKSRRFGVTEALPPDNDPD